MKFKRPVVTLWFYFFACALGQVFDARASVEDDLKALRIELKSTMPPNSYGTVLTIHESPRQVVSIVDRAVGVVRKAKLKPKDYPRLLGTITQEAIQILVSARGNTTPKDGTGWYPLNRSGATGLQEISQLLSYELLDDTLKQSLAGFIASIDFSSAQFLAAQGFPPTFTIGDRSIINNIAQEITNARSHPGYLAPVATNQAKLLSELMDDAITSGKMPVMQKAFIDKALIGNLESNLYDQSTAILKDPKAEFIDYFGRDYETDQVLQALNRIEKGHVLLTGKAGVGKTTILKILSDRFIKGDLKLRDEKPPIFLELPITSVTNTSDPSEIKSILNAAKLLAEGLDQRVVLYIDEAHVASSMTRNAIKGFLTESLVPGKNRVHLILSTTSNEAREFLQDTAFSRRFIEVNAKEFNEKETIALIQKSHLPRWKKIHQIQSASLGSITPAAYELAYRYASFEQPHAGNPTGTKELLEGTVIHSLKAESVRNAGRPAQVTITENHIRDYLRQRLNVELMPGDPHFESIFIAKMKAFSADFAGNEGFKYEIEKDLRQHYSTLQRRKMSSFVFFGPPGSGKTFAGEMLAKHFAGGAKLTINGAEYKNGGLELNKLIGSPSGTVGSEEQRSVLTKFLTDHPRGGVIVIEEADYLHHDIIQFLTNMVSDKKFTDGLGKEWNTSNYLLVLTSNIGQELMIPSDSKNRMSWEQYEVRRKQLFEKVERDGVTVERVREEKMTQIFERFVGEIVQKSNPGGDTSAVAQEAAKQRRRYKGFYIVNPDRAELEASAKSKIRRLIEDVRLDYGVQLEIKDSVLEKIIHLNGYEFEKGHSYIAEQIEDKLMNPLSSYFGERGATVSVIEGTDSERFRIVSSTGKQSDHSLPKTAQGPMNPWSQSPEMMQRVKTFASRMAQSLRGAPEPILETKELLKLKSLDWNTRVVITRLGTSGNGKTEFFKSMAVALYDSEQAMFKISGITNKFALSNYFRPPTGIQGGTQETEFERWFKSRLNSGGGIILFDELLSFSGLSQHEVSERLSAINELYDLLDEGVIKFGNKSYDARGFVIGITGNSLQEAFRGIPDDPSAEALVRQIQSKMTRSQVTKYLGSIGMDAPKVARLGKIFVDGPLPRKDTLEIGKIMIAKSVKEIKTKAGRNVEIEVDERINAEIVSKLTTQELGMREVNQGVRSLIIEPISGILVDLPHTKQISSKMESNGKITWYADGKKVILHGESTGFAGLEEQNWVHAKDVPAGNDRTPQFGSLNVPQKAQFTQKGIEQIATHEVLGHWMVEVMLTGKNPADAISLIPGDGYGGYVRPRTPLYSELPSLTSLLRESIVLEAGHRAVIIKHHVYATGGGPSGARRAGESASDDLGRIDQNIDRMISNQLIPNVFEKSSSSQQGGIRIELKKLIQAAADDLINKGIESGVFESVYQKAIQERFLSGEELDLAVSEIDFSKFKAFPAQLFLQAIQTGVTSVSTELHPSMNEVILRVKRELQHECDLNLLPSR